MNKRKEKRIAERNTVVIKSFGDGNGNGPTSSLSANAYTYDLSLGGTRLFTDKPFAVGTVIRIVIELARTCQSIQVDGEVKWVRENQADGVHEIGVEFLHAISQTILTLIRHLYSAGTEIPTSVTTLGVPPD
ncbi:MAG: PilZ domain-containing protein [Candidatus Aminicenantales bacterium]